MPPTIHRSERICIDISDNVVSIVKLDPEGVMMRAGSAKAPTMPQVPDDAYVTDLSSAIRKAAWSAKVSAGFGASCIVVTGMPEMTLQRFNWPDIPEDAIGAIAREEITPYLPGALNHFTVGCETLKQTRGEAGPPDMIEVLVAAMPVEHASAIITACKWANFKPKRLELRENARGRLAHYWCAPVEGEVPTTYAVLDVGPGMANIAFYQNGMFHSNRYFPPEIVKLDQVDDFELLMTVKTGGVDDNENAMRYAPEKLTEDIVSAVGHFHRMIGGATISCILLMDEENIPGIEESLRGNLRLPVLKPSQWVSPGLKRPNLRRIEQAQFLDAFAAGMPPLSNHGSRMDLRMDPMAAESPGFVQTQAKPTNTAIPAGPAPDEHVGAILAPPKPPVPEIQEPVYPQMTSSKEAVDDLFAPKQDTAPFRSDDDLFSSRKSDSYDDLFSKQSDMYDDPFPKQPDLYDDPYITKKTDPFDDPYISKPSVPYDDPFPARPPEPTSFGMDDLSTPDPEPHKAGHHEFPFDPVKAQPDDQGGFPYAIPEDPRPPRSFKPILAAFGLVAVILLVAILIPLQETIALRSRLQYLEASVAGHVSVEAIVVLEQERNQTYRQINARRTEVSQISMRMGIIREFYLLPPALIMIPEILEHSGLHVYAIEANNNHFVVTGSISDFLAIHAGTVYLRAEDTNRPTSPFGHLFNVAFDVDDDRPQYYLITITLLPNTIPFWLNQHIERSWQ